MHTDEFDYYLPTQRIAQASIEPRDHAKLMAINCTTRSYDERQFFDILEYLLPNDLVVWNNSKVFKARLFAKLYSQTGEELRGGDKKIELFLVKPMNNPGVWQALAKPAKRLSNGMVLQIADDFSCTVIAKERTGTIAVEFSLTDDEVRDKANQYGHIPIPPYVKDEPHQLSSYQTIYAKKEGSVAAPTAGFHFTDDLVEKMKAKGIDFAEVTLHVGLGTFLPVKTEKIEDHTMHSEWVEISEETAQKINEAKAAGRRIVAIGTTTVRTLEGVAAKVHGSDRVLNAYKGDIDIFISPGFEFNVVDAMVTNFHLPKSTLLMLVSAFAGDKAFLMSCYRDAVEKEYRFYSFGDGMFLYR